MRKLLCLFLAMLITVMCLNLAACRKRPGKEEPSGEEDASPQNTVMPPALEAGETALYDLRVDDLWEPVGIDSERPLFSWKMASAVTGQRQTAYQIVLSAKDGGTVWDSGRVETGDSVDIVYGGDELASSQEYTWQVTVWDKDGEAVTSPAAFFETALLGQDAFADTDFISFREAEVYNNTVYTIDLDFILESGSLGVCFGVTDANNLLMWQLNTVESPGRILLRPHEKSGGGWTVIGGNIDITETLGMRPNELIGRAMHERIEVNGKIIRTYLGTDENSLVLVNRYGYTREVPLQRLAFRMHANEKEIALVDNLRVTDETGAVLYENDFSGKTSGFADGGAGELTDGMYRIGISAGAEEHIMLQSSGNGQLPGYRRSFRLTKELASARLYTCGLGVYESYLNGERIGRRTPDGRVVYQELKPGFTEESRRKYYSSFDVTQMLKAGEENVLAAIVADGWWSGLVGGNYGKNNAYLAKLILTYTDGSREVITTGPDWKAACVSPFLEADIFNGETYDARITNDWMLPGYDDSSWAGVSVNTEFTGELEAWKGSFITVREDLERPVQSVTVYDGAEGASSGRYGKIHTVRTADSGSFTLQAGETALVDFGQNASGWEAFTVEGASGTVLTVEHGEILNDRNGEISRGNDGPGGSIYNANYRSAAARTRYILRGNGPESYHPSFTFYGFRYIEITATAPVTFSAMKAETVTSVELDTGFLETGNADIDRLISNIRWGQYSNYLSVPTDCPQRDERQGWTADTQVFAEAGCYLGFSKSFLEKFLQDLRDAQAADGSYPGTAPTGEYHGNAWGGTGWADAGILVPYILYVHYDDLDAVEKSWDSMLQYMDGFLKKQGKHGPSNIWGDWLAYESNDSEIQDMLAVAYYAWDAQLMAEMAQALGYTEKASEYQELFETEKEYFIRRYVRSDGSLRRGEQTACLYALYLNLLPDADSFRTVREQLVSNIRRNGNKLQTGFLGTRILLDTLSGIGEQELAYTLLLQTENPSWLYSVQQGATTVWERWNSYTLTSGFGDVGMNSFNHYAYSAVAAWMFRTMAGINADPETPGFRHMTVAPYPDARLGTVKASYNSACGPISVDSHYTDGSWEYTLTLPANTSATVRLPLLSFAGFTVNGKAPEALTEETDGIRYVATEDGVMIFEAVAGTFTFLGSGN